MTATQQHMIDAYRALQHGTPPPPPPGRASLRTGEGGDRSGGRRSTPAGRSPKGTGGR
ncbi:MULTISPECIES: hypothetical protein [Streptomyces]|uniref:Uncharacterized protein n=1 Tax=Streptomyces lichenis TaxID=2306967 RepID=A0ABT0I970_9ACTN|nr:hypothetical protein [Streptomyces lichenis]MCK8677858.1 hypothetical protein [Streptomyces lichenis]